MVDKALASGATHPDEVLGLVGRYGEDSGLALKQAAEIALSKPERLYPHTRYPLRVHGVVIIPLGSHRYFDSSLLI